MRNINLTASPRTGRIPAYGRPEGSALNPMPNTASNTLPNWRQSTLDCPAIWRNWLMDSQSLTRRLQRQSPGNFSVTVLRQTLTRPRRDEAMALGIPHTQLTLVREVILNGDGQPRVFARSVIPLPALRGKLRFLQRLGNRPLGEFLFKNPAIKRGPIWLTRWPIKLLPDIPGSNVSTSWGTPRDTVLWARYSIFRHQQAGILVSEVFLPSLLSHTTGKTTSTPGRFG